MHTGNQQKTTELSYKYHTVLYLILIDLQKVDINNDMFLIEIIETVLKKAHSLVYALLYYIYACYVQSMDFVQSMDCPAQSNDPCFAQNSMDCAVVVQTMDLC